jgi:hypothetical protein
MGLTRFSVDVGSGGRGHVVIDGVDVAEKVQKIIVDSTAGQPPQVFLEMAGEGRIEGEGIVTQVVESNDSIALFLSNLDPSALEAAALDKMGGLDGEGLTTGQAFLAALMEEFVRVYDDGA